MGGEDEAFARSERTAESALSSAARSSVHRPRRAQPDPSFASPLQVQFLIRFEGTLGRRPRSGAPFIRHPYIREKKSHKERVMLDTAFASPIVVLVGMGFPLEIKGVMDAVRYMDGQPAQSRDEAFHATYGACRDALEGNASVAEARDVLCALARRRGVLVEERRSRPASAVAGGSLAA
ncbi:DUF982 domain-containing protein [Mesorhizobium sp. YM1C-6-2]|nr:DUF982 domain-containing protein [Mesorhizobium sp. YM1C-6-2]